MSTKVLQQTFRVCLSILPVLLLSQAFAQISMTVYRDNPGQHVPTLAVVEACSAELGIEVDTNIITSSNRQTVLTTALEAGSGPDILTLVNFEPYLYAQSLLDVSDLAAEAAEANGGWFPIAEELAHVDNTWRALPVYIYMHMLIYRKSAFEAAGIGVPDTWDEFRAALVALRDSGGVAEPFGIPFGRSIDGQQFLMSVLLSYGAQIIDEEGTVVFNSPETVEGLTYVIDLFRDGLIDPTVVGWDDSTNNQLVLGGRIATTFNGFSIKQQAITDFPELAPDIGAAIYPTGPVQRTSFPVSFSYGIRASTAYPDESRAILGCVMRRANVERVLVETNGAVGTPFMGFSDLAIWDDPDFATNLESIETAALFATPSPATANAEGSYIVSDMLADVLVNNLTPEEAVARATERLEEIYGQ